jgi:hypothetical protein
MSKVTLSRPVELEQATGGSAGAAGHAEVEKQPTPNETSSGGLLP